MITFSIDVTKIDKSRIKDGKYLNLVLDTLREPDKFGNTHSVYMSQTKEERADKAKRIYIGNGKEWAGSKTQSAPPQSNSINTGSDLPF